MPATAGPTIREEEEVEDHKEEADEDEDGDGTPKRREEEEEEDNTLSLAQMEPALKPDALERFARITDLFKKFEKLQTERVDVLGRGEDFPAAKERKYEEYRLQLTAAAWRDLVGAQPSAGLEKLPCVPAGGREGDEAGFRHAVGGLVVKR